MPSRRCQVTSTSTSTSTSNFELLTSSPTLRLPAPCIIPTLKSTDPLVREILAAMPTVDCIDVRIRADDRPLKEYTEPGVNDDDDHNKVRYIESIAGQQFSVVVQLLPNFRLNHARWFYAGFEIDDDTTKNYLCAPAENLHHRNGYLQATFCLQDQGDSVFWDDSCGQWVRSAFTFGALGTSASDRPALCADH